MSNICLVLLVGIPGVGKTTFCHKLKSWAQDFCLHIISYDDLCMDYTSASRKEVFSQVEILIEESLVNKLLQTHLIIIDDNMYYKSMRNRYFNLAKRFELGFFKVYFDTSLQIAIDRNEKRTNSKVPVEVLINIYCKLEVPTINTLVINTIVPIGYDTYQKFQCQVRDSLTNPVKSIQVVEVENICKTSSKLHDIDLILRKIVREQILNNLKCSSKYNVIKSVVFSRIKSGDIDVNNLSDEALTDYLRNFFNV